MIDHDAAKPGDTVWVFDEYDNIRRGTVFDKSEHCNDVEDQYDYSVDIAPFGSGKQELISASNYEMFLSRADAVKDRIARLEENVEHDETSIDRWKRIIQEKTKELREAERCLGGVRSCIAETQAKIAALRDML